MCWPQNCPICLLESPVTRLSSAGSLPSVYTHSGSPCTQWVTRRFAKISQSRRRPLLRDCATNNVCCAGASTLSSVVATATCSAPWASTRRRVPSARCSARPPTAAGSACSCAPTTSTPSSRAAAWRWGVSTPSSTSPRAGSSGTAAQSETVSEYYITLFRFTL